VVLTSPDKSHDQLFLGNYAAINLVDELSRIPGVGDTRTIPANSYSMRIWLDRDKMHARGLAAQDVINALQEQNIQVAAGEIGQPPAPPGQMFQFTVQTLGRLSDVSQFENIIVKTASPGQSPTQTQTGMPVSTATSAEGFPIENEGVSAPQITRLKEVAQVELGGQSYDQFFELNGRPAAGIAVYQLPGANSLDVAKRIRQKLEELKKAFPQGVTYTIPFDTTIFVAQSIHEVYWTLFEAGFLVLLVIMVFLQDWRAVLVPATTVPVTIIGAFVAMSALGFTVNMLTLFGLILAIGIVVDDAIVIVEAASYHIERGLTPKEAAIQAMSELQGPIIGITLVLLAVFIPAAMMGGITGQLYRQFALTIAATAVISAINAMTLKPTQSAQWLRKAPARRNIFFRAFNRVYGGVENVYVRMTRWVVRHTAIVFLTFALLFATGGWLYWSLPTGFLPIEDQGYAIISAVLPDAASLERTHAVVDKLHKIIEETPGIANHVAIGGNDILSGSAIPNAATIFITFKDWSERNSADQSLQGILNKLQHRFGEIQEATVVAFPPPSIRGLGTAGGFQMELENRGGEDLKQLAAVTDNMVEASSGQPALGSVTSSFRADVPQIYVDVDRAKAKVLGVPLTSVFTTLDSYLGSRFVNEFNKYGRTYQVRVQGLPQYRDNPDDIKALYTTNQKGGMTPLGTLVNIQKIVGPQVVTRYNLYPAAQIIGQSAPSVSSGQALNLMESLAGETLPPGFTYEWTAMSYQEKLVGGQAILAFSFAILLVYLVLAAQYESLTSPAAVIFVTPLALLGAALAVAIRGMDNNVYTQVGIVLIIALASKNAILIVEVARELRADGHGILEAAIEAGRRRFRPIIMTSFAFILGVVPLLIARGAGGASRQALGTAVFGGMLAATILAVGFVPAFFVIWERTSAWWRERRTR
jgi:HAE1 family hydrophobic/amphiphilic exporter-1